MAARFQLGTLGRGWSHNFEYRLERPDYYRATLHGPAGSARTFTQYANLGWQAEPGDAGTLTEGADDSYTLREKDGLTLRFDVAGVLNSIEEPNGNALALGYDGSGRLIEVAHANGERLRFFYGGSGRITSMTDAFGGVVNYAYDGEHLASVTLPGGQVTSYTYESGGASAHALSAITYPDSTHRYYSYDAQGRLIEQVRDDNAEPVQFSYLSPGGVVVTDATAASSTLHLGASGEVLEALDPLGRQVALQYDADLNLTRLTDPAGGLSEMSYDSRGNAQTISDALAQVISLGYTEEFSGLDWLRDGSGNETDFLFDFDGDGNLTAITYPDASDEEFGYDAFGNLTTVINRRGQTVTYSYDSLGRVTRKSLQGGRTIDYGYDARGNLTSAADSLTGTIAMLYDARDFLARIEYPNGTWFTFEYNDAGRRTRRTGHDGYVLDYAYDSAGRLSSITEGGGAGIVAYQYDDAGRLIREDKGNGTYTTYEYDPAGQMLSVVNYAPDAQVQSRFDYTYDANGNPTSISTLAGVTSYGYDATGQLTGVSYPGRTVTYAYDPAGNRTTVTEDGVPTTYTGNTLNQYTHVGPATCGYDADGNMTSRTEAGGATTYEYDVENRLVRVVTPSEGTWEYHYDALGNRLAVTHDGITTWYLHDPIGLVNVVAEYDDAGTLVARYDHGLGLVARTDAAGDPAYYAFDAIGHTRALTDASGAVVNQYDYDPFGIPLQMDETVPNPFGYVGRWGVMAEGNGLTYMRARYYEAGVGRFVNEDPIGLAAGDASVRRYCRNAPLGWVDPTGTEGADDQLGGFLVDWLDFGTYVAQRAIEIKLQTAKTSYLAGQVLQGGFFRAENLRALQGLGNVLTLVSAPGALNRAGNAWGDYGYTSAQWASGRAGFWDLVHDGAIAWGKTAFAFVPFAQDFVDAWDQATYDLFMTLYLGAGWSTMIRPIDPNEKTAPLGYGEAHFVPVTAETTYVIYFENQAGATAPAQEILITDQLSADLDWSTFQLGEIVFGRQVVGDLAGMGDSATTTPLRDSPLVVTVDAGLNEASGQAHWTLRTIDPRTGELPEDPMAGLLPPNSPPDGRGEGHVTFTIRPRAGLATGTVVRNTASIVFDTNDPIATAEVFNTIDAGEPSSQVLPLPAQSPPQFLVEWQGEDDVGGSGLRGCDIYVSDNGAGYLPWLSGTTENSALFAGEEQHTYTFYSVACDNVGNSEAVPASPDTATTVVSAHAISVNAFASPLAVESGGTIELNATASDELSHDMSSWRWTDHGAGGSFAPSESVQNPTYQAPTNTSAGDLVIRLEAIAGCAGAPTAWGTGSVEVTVFPESVFPDVPHEHWAFSQIWSCVQAGIVSGYGDGSYRPLGQVDRAAMAVYIARALTGGDAYVAAGPGVATFPDVPTDHWAYKYVEYCHDHDVVGGYGDGTYRPDVIVNRGAMAAYVARAVAGGERWVPDDPDGTPFFSDVATTHWAYKYVEYCHDQSVVGGYEDGTYRPDVIVNRDAMAVYVQRAFALPM
jgi:RHS repeat-associated protein